MYVAWRCFHWQGLADALYLTIEHLAGRSVPCSVTGGCEEVLTSSYAVIAGIPLAAVGAAAISRFSVSRRSRFSAIDRGNAAAAADGVDGSREPLADLFAGFCDSGVLPVLSIVGSDYNHRCDRVLLAWKKGSLR